MIVAISTVQSVVKIDIDFDDLIKEREVTCFISGLAEGSALNRGPISGPLQRVGPKFRLKISGKPGT